MLNFLLRNTFAKLGIHILLSMYEVGMNLMPDIILAASEGSPIDWVSLVSTRSFWVTVILNAAFALFSAGIKSFDKKEVELYNQTHIQHYIDETTEIALAQMRSGKHRLAKKTMQLQERHISKVRKE